MTLQYIRPVMMGDSSPAMTASIVSSRSPRPADTWPCWMSARPCTWRAAAVRSASLKRSPIAAASAAVVCAASSLAFTELLLGDGQDQVAALHAVMALDEPLPSRDPGVRLPRLSSQQEAETEPERTAGGALPVAGLAHARDGGDRGIAETRDRGRSGTPTWPAVRDRRHPRGWPHRRTRAPGKRRSSCRARSTHGRVEGVQATWIG